MRFNCACSEEDCNETDSRETGGEAESSKRKSRRGLKESEEGGTEERGVWILLPHRELCNENVHSKS